MALVHLIFFDDFLTSALGANLVKKDYKRRYCNSSHQELMLLFQILTPERLGNIFSIYTCFQHLFLFINKTQGGWIDTRNRFYASNVLGKVVPSLHSIMVIFFRVQLQLIKQLQKYFGMEHSQQVRFCPIEIQII